MSVLSQTAPPFDTYGTLGRVDHLARKILNGKRGMPIVLLTARKYEEFPALDPDFVRAMVGSEVDVCFVPSMNLTRHLEDLLPPKLAAFGGAARIYWPGVDERSSGEAHPLVVDHQATYGTLAERRFAEAWQRGPLKGAAAKRDHPDLARVRAERDKATQAKDELIRERGELQKAVISARAEAARLREEVSALRAEVKSLRHAGESGQVNHTERTPADALRRGIFEAYLEAIDEDERDERTMGQFVFRDGFVESVAELEPDARQRVPLVCAMVLCGVAHSLGGLLVHRLREGEGGGTRDRVRASDGAHAMRCAIQKNTASAPRLHYWQPKKGPVEFVLAVRHNDARCPE